MSFMAIKSQMHFLITARRYKIKIEFTLGVNKFHINLKTGMIMKNSDNDSMRVFTQFVLSPEFRRAFSNNMSLMKNVELVVHEFIQKTTTGFVLSKKRIYADYHTDKNLQGELNDFIRKAIRKEYGNIVKVTCFRIE